MKKNCRKQSNKKFRIGKLIEKKGDKLYDLKNETGVDRSKFAQKVNLASLKSNVDKLSDGAMA